jgi:hypothetical protein
VARVGRPHDITAAQRALNHCVSKLAAPSHFEFPAVAQNLAQRTEVSTQWAFIHQIGAFLNSTHSAQDLLISVCVHRLTVEVLEEIVVDSPEKVEAAVECKYRDGGITST